MIQTFSPVYDVDACLANIKECLEKGWTGVGFKTIEFEEAWKAYTGLPNAHFLCSGTAGLNLALRLLKEENGWNDGDEIISTPLTFIATNNSILVNNLTPVFADIDNTLCLDPDDVIKKISPKTKAVIFVGIGGNAGHYKKVFEICKERGLKLVLDAAHMSGTQYKSRQVGAEADAVVFSFHVTKNLSTADGGMLCFKDKALDTKARNMSWNGIDRTSSPKKYGKHFKWKYNVEKVVDAYNGNSIMAAIALAQLPHLDSENAHRRSIASVYRRELANIEGIGFVEEIEDVDSSQWLFQILVDDRDGLMQFMEENGVKCSLHYLDNTEYPMYANLAGTCPKASYVSDHVVSLPLHLRLTEGDVIDICRLVKSFLKGNTGE